MKKGLFVALAGAFALAFTAAATDPAEAGGWGKKSKKSSVFIMQGYSGKPARPGKLQGTSAVKITKRGNVSLWGPGKSPHKKIHIKRGFAVR